MNVNVWLGDKECRLHIEEVDPGHFRVTLADKPHAVTAEFINPEEVLLAVDGKVYNVTVSANGFGHSAIVNGRVFSVERRLPPQALRGDKGRRGRREVKTTMPGRVVRVLAREGEEVEEGQAVLVLEAMKMQNEIKSPQAGRVARIYPRAGQAVEAGSALFTVE